ncbi:MAG: NAD(P)H-dependent oxidoreductase subunit E [Gaiella sp.]
MDLKLLEAEATPTERDALDRLLGLPTNVWEGADRDETGAGRVARGGSDVRERRHLLLPALHALNDRVGWLSPGGMNEVCRRLGVPPADAYGVATFYALLSVEPRPATVLHVCEDLACRCNGSETLIAALEERIGPEGSDTGTATWLRSPCLGQCDRAPAALLTLAGEEHREHVLAPLDAEAALRALAGEPGSVDPVTPAPQAGEPSLRLLRRIGEVEPTSLDDYRACGGYAALRRAFALGPEGVIRELKDSNLLCRGGAAFPSGVKWDAVARQPAQPHYLVCNADESEPGTFKDRVLMEGDPYAVVEAMTIAAYATDCGKGYLYLRGEYPQAHAILEESFAEARARGFLGDDILGQGFAFDIELRKGAGAYICGEETAIFNSIEGFRGEPRSKPPFPVVSGLFGKPTVVNNVETLVNVLDVILGGGPAFSAVGTESSTGTKLFCVSGCVPRPGTYEVEFGTTLRELLTLAGGVRYDNALRAVLLGGAAGGFVGPDQLDLPLTFEAAREAGATLGSGVILVFDETVDLDPILMQIAAFFRNESCGQCVPCRVGTVRQQEALARLQSGRTRGSVEDELALLDEIALVMKDASICGLGQTAAGAIQTAIGRIGMYKASS